MLDTRINIVKEEPEEPLDESILITDLLRRIYRKFAHVPMTKDLADRITIYIAKLIHESFGAKLPQPTFPVVELHPLNNTVKFNELLLVAWFSITPELKIPLHSEDRAKWLASRIVLADDETAHMRVREAFFTPGGELVASYYPKDTLINSLIHTHGEPNSDTKGSYSGVGPARVHVGEKGHPIPPAEEQSIPTTEEHVKMTQREWAIHSTTSAIRITALAFAERAFEMLASNQSIFGGEQKFAQEMNDHLLNMESVCTSIECDFND